MKPSSFWHIRQSIKKRVDGVYRTDCCVVDVHRNLNGIIGTVILRDMYGRARSLRVTAKMSPQQVCEFATLWVTMPSRWDDRPHVARMFLNRCELDRFLAI